MSLKRNTLWNLFGSASPMLIGLVSLPYILEKIGVEKLGILTLIWSLIGYFSVFDFGLGRALTQKISSLRVAGSHSDLVAAARSGMLLVFLAGLGGAFLVIVPLTVLGVHWLNVSESSYDYVYRSIFIASVAIPVTTATSGLKGILEGFQEFRIVNIYRFILGTANFLSPVIAVALFGPSLPAIVMLLLLSRLCVMLLHLWSTAGLIGFKAPQTDPGTDHAARDLLIFGSWMTLSNLLSPLMDVADRFVISSLLQASVVAYYAVPSDFLIRLLMIPAALTTALFPVFAAKLQLNSGEGPDLYRRSLKLVSLVMTPILASIALGGHIGLSFWLGDEFADHAYQVVAVLSVGLLFNSLAQTPHTAIQAKGNAKLTSLIHVGEFVVYAPLLYLMVKYYGIVGAAFVWTGRAMVDFFALHYFALRTMGRKEW